MIGAGNVAFHISRHLFARGHQFTCVWSRDTTHAGKLAALLGSRGTNDPADVPEDADFYLMAIPDRAIGEVAGSFSGRKGIWLHTAGTVPMKVLNSFFGSYGVLYPLQTLSYGRNLSLVDTPFLIEGSGEAVLHRIRQLATCISEKIVEMDSQGRMMMHLAAVFANNFSNHMVLVAEQILEKYGLDLSLLTPLLRETFRKMEEMGAGGARTGPAMRNDKETMRKHLELLRDHPEWEKIYTFVSRDIGRSRLTQKNDPASGDDQF